MTFKTTEEDIAYHQGKLEAYVEMQMFIIEQTGNGDMKEILDDPGSEADQEAQDHDDGGPEEGSEAL